MGHCVLCTIYKSNKWRKEKEQAVFSISTRMVVLRGLRLSSFYKSHCFFVAFFFCFFFLSVGLCVCVYVERGGGGVLKSSLTAKLGVGGYN